MSPPGAAGLRGPSEGQQSYLPRVALALLSSPGRCTRGFHTVRGDVDPGQVIFRHQVVGVVDIWRKIRTGDGSLASLGGVGFIFEPQPTSDRPVRLGFLRFYTLGGGIDPEKLVFRPGLSCRCTKGRIFRE